MIRPNRIEEIERAKRYARKRCAELGYPLPDDRPRGLIDPIPQPPHSSQLGAWSLVLFVPFVVWTGLGFYGLYRLIFG